MLWNDWLQPRPEGAEPLLPRKKQAIMFGYSGTNYLGLQINKQFPTVEKALEQAIFDAGGLFADNRDFAKIHWSRACRTLVFCICRHHQIVLFRVYIYFYLFFINIG
jgi:hypothetical protein